ncbi:hypothetical protein Leryth_027607 [Lithospermum erythrorhizon]|nr:hypothetical protein Leryth_027607 [Lithospermum erythrorhizon]
MVKWVQKMVTIRCYRCLMSMLEKGESVWAANRDWGTWFGESEVTSRGIYNEDLASPSVKRSKREGHILVAFFGDSSYGWFELAELIPFEPNFDEKSRQTSSKTFVRAVEDAVDELNRRSWLGLACRCRNPYNFRPTTVDGSYAVDVGDNESGIFSVSQIKKARDNFRPREMLVFMKKLALTPMADGNKSINFVKHRASALAYRKAKFEEFDETYAQAFGAHPVRPDPKTAADLQKEPSRAPLSGPLVFAEALGKGKAAAKSAKPRDQVDRDRYLFKRRDELHKVKARKAGKGQPPSEPTQLDRSNMSGRETSTSAENQVLQITGVGDSSQSPSDQPTSATKSTGDNGMKLHVEDSESGPKKSKAKKRPAGKLLSEDSVPEKKKKKRKKEAGAEFSSDHNQIPMVSGGGVSVVKAAGTMDQDSSTAEFKFEAGNQNKDDSKSVCVTSTVEGNLKEKQTEDDAALTAIPLDSMKTKQIDGSRNNEAELRKYIADLRALALNHFHCAERSGSLFVRNIFLKYRALVYQKSLVSLVPADADPSESRMSKLPSSAEVLDNHPTDHVKETLPVKPVKLLKPSSRAEDPTIGGRKRGSSDRQEEIAAKRKKKITTLKAMSTEKKSLQKASDAHRGEATGKLAALTSASVRSESYKRTEPVVKLSDPTMLIMKFPPGAALPSLNELKAKFTRFGTLDASKTRIFWQSSQVRLVYLHRKQAESASKFASSVWNTNVRCSLRDLSADTLDSGQSKVEDAAVSASNIRESGIEQRQMPKLAPPQLSSQLKSCLKKLPVDEGGSMSSGGNGSGRGTRVKFVLGGEESSNTEQLMVGSKHVNSNASFVEGAVSSSSSSTSHAMDFNSKNIQKVISSSQLPSVPLLPAQFPEASNNMFFNEGTSRNIPNFNIQPLAPPMMPRTPDNDITQQMISLLTKCSEVVSSLKGTLGYVPYHPL